MLIVQLVIHNSNTHTNRDLFRALTNMIPQMQSAQIIVNSTLSDTGAEGLPRLDIPTGPTIIGARNIIDELAAMCHSYHEIKAQKQEITKRQSAVPISQNGEIDLNAIMEEDRDKDNDEDNSNKYIDNIQKKLAEFNQQRSKRYPIQDEGNAQNASKNPRGRAKSTTKKQTSFATNKASRAAPARSVPQGGNNTDNAFVYKSMQQTDNEKSNESEELAMMRHFQNTLAGGE